MTREEILQQVIKRAMDNGWNKKKVYEWYICEDEYTGNLVVQTKTSINKVRNDWEVLGTLNDIIFDKDFAKAFWGEEDKYIEKYIEIMEGEVFDEISVEEYEERKPVNKGWDYFEPVYAWRNKGWQYHLQQMVLEENPLEYLAKFLKGK